MDKRSHTFRDSVDYEVTIVNDYVIMTRLNQIKARLGGLSTD